MKMSLSRFVLLSAVAFLPVPANAETPVEVNIKLTSQELDLIGTALGSQPYNQAFPLMNKLRQQWIDQQPKEAVVPSAPKKE